MNTNDLKIFEAVAANGSFTKAAEAMFTVQSNVTARIKSLEDEFNIHLFTRTSRKVELTAAGETLMYYCKQISHLVEEAKKDLSKTTQLLGQLKIGCIETTMALNVPGMINQFTDAYPDIELEFQSANSGDLVTNVMNYKLDAAFVAAPITLPGLEQHQVKEDQLVIVTSEAQTSLKHALENKPVKIVVFDQGCIYRSRLESWLSSKGIINYKSTVLNSLEGIINFVEAGIGFTILPAGLVNQYYASRKLKTFAINKELGTLNTVIIFRKNVPQSRALKAFLEMYSPKEINHELV
ncbi:LysR family transcriptional regulator [Pedobacter sp. L105]|uniref:LysR family transcriptional regulator n=1 Tax=Pedobacter sp. L105 TaxID=1641871 RepID=UPI00131A8C38|nr:LysR family transcriptional regulator [Pedobacter sp. L105]